MKLYTKSIFVFHKSLRLHDNLGLMDALKNSDHVICIFIFTPEQIGPTNKFRSLNAINFMMEGLNDLNKSLRDHKSKLYHFFGDQASVIENIIKKDDQIGAVYINKDYTKYALDREDNIKKILEKHNLPFIIVEDILLQPAKSVLNETGDIYSKFTPYYNKAVKIKVDKPKTNKYHNYIRNTHEIKDDLTDNDIEKLIKKFNLDNDEELNGTRKEALEKVNEIKDHKNYDKNKDMLNKETTHLSSYIKFGLVSIREIYHKILELFGKSHPLIRQLYWRDFYYNLGYERSDVFQGASYKTIYDSLNWDKDTGSNFSKWKDGKTGFPIVDAGMRELNETGFMHNRARLITANFLVKLLLIDWRKGEKYYASKLTDYDPAVNNGNWQWVAGSGADSQPYFRIFNPWLQAEKFDPECEYIYKYVPELKDVPIEDIHNWSTAYKNHEHIKYPAPMIDYLKSKKYTLKVYAKIFK